MVAFFDDLPDLTLIEILSYLSCADALWAFSKLNTRLTNLLIERSFYRHINLSSIRHYQFQTLLPLLRLNEIHSLVIYCYASPLQLSKWPHLPRLQTLRVKGLCDYFDICHFALKHASTLTYLIVESSTCYSRRGVTNQDYLVSWSLECLEDFMKKILQRLPALRLLDLGMESSFFLHNWCLEIIRTPLTYLRITCSATTTLIDLMLTQPLPHTLQQLHVKLNDVWSDSHIDISAAKLSPRMEALHTFTFVKSFKWHRGEWTFVNILTSSSIMPILQRMNFSIVINADDLNDMNHSDLFTDYRHVDVRYAFIIDDNRSHSELTKYIPFHSQSHSRQIGSATFIADFWPDNQPFTTPGEHYKKKPKNRQHLFYTLPWIFNEFFQLCVPGRCIKVLQVFTLNSPSKTIASSRLVQLNVSDNIPSSATLLPYVMSSNQIIELHLCRCNRQFSLDLPMVTHLTLIDSLDSLNSRPLATTIRSIQIILHRQCLDFTSDNWIALRTLAALPVLKSLHVLLYDMVNPPDDISCEIIAQTALIVIDFGFCFRHRYDIEYTYDIDLVYTKHSLFIECLRNRIVNLSLNEELHIVIDEDGCGILIWF